MDFKDPAVQKGIIVVILCAMIGYVYFFTSFLPFFFHPTKVRIVSLSSEYEKMSAELEKARRTVDNLPKLEEEYEKLHEKWVAAQGLLPEEKEVADLLRKVTGVGTQAGVDFLLFEPKAPVAREFITENPVHVKVRGEYHQLGIFLSKVANLDRIVNVSNLTIKAIDRKGNTKEDRLLRNYTVEAEMTLTAYTLVEGGATTDGSKAAKKPNNAARKS